MMWPFAGAAALGWALGANDAANVYGTAVSVGVLRFRTAAWIASLCVLAGAVLEGAAGLSTVSDLTRQMAGSAEVILIASALAVIGMTYLRYPVSTSQSVAGALAGTGLARGMADFSGFTKLVICWLATPLGACLISLGLYWILGRILTRAPISILTRDRWLWIGVVVAGAYGAYALGANNVANVTGVLVGAGLVTPLPGALLGGIAISLGIVTFSRRVMHKVGRGLVRLDAFTALIVVLAEAITVHIFAVIGVPVSATQAVIGGVVGVGWAHGAQGVHLDVLAKIGLAWLGTPTLALGLAFVLQRLLG